LKYLSSNEKDTINLGEDFAKKCKGGEIFLLSGELGGGKTQFVKGLAKGLGISDNITSPTFTYERIYLGKKLTLYHFDLYREKTLDPDIRALMEEAFADPKSITAVEWAERMKSFKPKFSHKLIFTWKGEHEREIIVK
jgi:tRNA threonylcarbamoyladenosine biosynthesis protein TsaE